MVTEGSLGLGQLIDPSRTGVDSCRAHNVTVSDRESAGDIYEPGERGWR